MSEKQICKWLTCPNEALEGGFLCEAHVVQVQEGRPRLRVIVGNVAKQLTYNVVANLLIEVLKAALKGSAGIPFLTRDYLETQAGFRKAVSQLEAATDDSQIVSVLAEIELLGPAAEARVLKGFVFKITVGEHAPRTSSG